VTWLTSNNADVSKTSAGTAHRQAMLAVSATTQLVHVALLYSCCAFVLVFMLTSSARTAIRHLALRPPRDPVCLPRPPSRKAMWCCRSRSSLL